MRALTRRRLRSTTGTRQPALTRLERRSGVALQPDRVRSHTSEHRPRLELRRDVRPHRGTSASRTIFPPRRRPPLVSECERYPFSAQTTDVLEGNLDFHRRQLNLSAGTAAQALISDVGLDIAYPNVSSPISALDENRLACSQSRSRPRTDPIGLPDLASGSFADGITYWIATATTRSRSTAHH